MRSLHMTQHDTELNDYFLRFIDCVSQTALYGALHAAGITLLSIAHRPALRAFHNAVIHFEGGQLGSDGSGWSVEELAAPPTYIPAAASGALELMNLSS